MKNVILVCVLAAFVTPLSESTFQKLFGLIKAQRIDVSALFKEEAKKKPKYECVAAPFKRRVLRESEVSFDAGYDGCGWEMSSIHFFCKGLSVRNLWAEIRRVPSPAIVKTTSLISEDRPDQIYNVPVGVSIRKISTGYIFEGDSQFVSQLNVFLSNGESKTMKCGNAEVFVHTEVAENQKIDGMQMVLDKYGRFSYIDFHTHEILGINGNNGMVQKMISGSGPGKKFKYLDFFKSRSLRLARLEDDFFLRGSVGKSVGTYFVDQKYYNDWQLSSVRIESDKQRILSVQLILTHTIFDKSVRTRVQGNQLRDVSKTKTLIIPKGQHLSLARFYLDPKGVLCGLKLSIYNGNESDCFGSCPVFYNPKDEAQRTKTVYFSNKDNIVGFFGYAESDRINSLGFLLNIKRGTEGIYFVTSNS